MWVAATVEFGLSSAIKLLTIDLREITAVPVFYKIVTLTNHVSAQRSLNLRYSLVSFMYSLRCGRIRHKIIICNMTYDHKIPLPSKAEIERQSLMSAALYWLCVWRYFSDLRIAPKGEWNFVTILNKWLCNFLLCFYHLLSLV